MYDHDDILIVGDSFAQHRDYDSDWPKLLTKLQTGSTFCPRGFGFGGASWWSARKCLLAEVEVKMPKVLVLCHTEPSRIPSDFNYALNIATATATAKGHNNKIHSTLDPVIHAGLKNAAEQYYMHLYCQDHAVWTQDAWFAELEHKLTQWNIPKVVHLHCFPPHKKQHLYCFNTGVTNSVPLWNLCRNVEQLQGVRNHFTPDQNIKIALAINTVLLNYPQSNGIIDMKLLG